MDMLIAGAIILTSFAAMEAVAWAAHKHVMHGFGWNWHRDHHEPGGGVFAKNDLYAILGAANSIALFAWGSEWIMGERAWWPASWIGLGVTLYGIAYTLVHDGLIHQRHFRLTPRSGYARRLVQAHRLHHAAIGRQGGVSFGFLLARDPARLKAELAAQARAGKVKLRAASEGEARGAGKPPQPGPAPRARATAASRKPGAAG